MKQKLNRNATSTGLFAAALLLITLNAQLSTLFAQGTAFGYQGRLTDNGSPANGNYDLQFDVRDAAPAGNQVGPTSTLLAVAVSNGLFSVTLDFGAGVFTGPARWLEIGVRTNGGNNFKILSPRQPLTPVPYAIYATNAGTATTATGVAAGSVTAAGLASGQVVKSLNGLTDAVTLAPGDNVTLTTSGNRLTVSSGGGAGVFSLSGTNAYYNGGNVGIGTTTPHVPLELQSGFGTEVLRFALDSGDFHSVSTGFHGTKPWLNYLGFNLEYNSSDIRRVMTLLGDGSVGIGTSTPGKTLTIAGDAEIGTSSGDYHHLRIGGGNSDGFLYGSYPRFGDGIHLGYNYYADAAGTDQIIHPDGATSRISVHYGSIVLATGGVGQVPAERLRVDSSGSVGIGTAFPQARLDVAGETRTCVLTITGGCDLAEPFAMSDGSIPSGALVAIDEEHPGQLKMSTRAYDQRAAGIISGANGIKPGISLHQEGTLEGGQNVALTGRVYALADASNGSIKPGDLLTTSDTPGHCMRAADHARAKGAIVGKAMTALDKGKGMVLVLVSLQ